MKALLVAWKRLWLTRGERHKRASEAKQARAHNPYHRHTAFLELP